MFGDVYVVPFNDIFQNIKARLSADTVSLPPPYEILKYRHAEETSLVAVSMDPHAFEVRKRSYSSDDNCENTKLVGSYWTEAGSHNDNISIGT